MTEEKEKQGRDPEIWNTVVWAHKQQSHCRLGAQMKLLSAGGVTKIKFSSYSDRWVLKGWHSIKSRVSLCHLEVKLVISWKGQKYSLLVSLENRWSNNFPYKTQFFQACSPHCKNHCLQYNLIGSHCRQLWCHIFTWQTLCCSLLWPNTLNYSNSYHRLTCKCHATWTTYN